MGLFLFFLQILIRQLFRLFDKIPVNKIDRYISDIIITAFQTISFKNKTKRNNLSRNVRKRTFAHVRLAKIQISLRIAQADLNLHLTHFG